MKKKILTSLFMICAVFCVGLCFTACGGETPWMAVTVSTEQPTGIYHIGYETYRGEVPGAEQGSNMVFTIEYDVGYDGSTCKVLANGTEITQKELVSANNYMEFWKYTVPNVQENINITFAGTVKKKDIGVNFRFGINEYEYGDALDDVRFNINGKTNLTFAQLKEYFSNPVPCKHEEELVLETISSKGFYDKLLVDVNRQPADTGEQYELGGVFAMESYDLRLSGFQYPGGLEKDVLTLTGSNGDQITRLDQMEASMTLTVSDNSDGYGASVYEYLTAHSDDTSVYFTVNGQKVALQDVTVENGKIVISNVLPAWEYKSGFDISEQTHYVSLGYIVEVHGTIAE